MGILKDRGIHLAKISGMYDISYKQIFELRATLGLNSSSKGDSMDIQEVLNRLGNLDFELKSLNKQDKLKFVIFGGTAFMLLTQDFRETFDIDIVLLNKVIQEHEFAILGKYDINNAMQGVAFLPDGYESRMSQMDIPFSCLEVYVPDPIDLIINKLLSRADQRDLNDVIHSGIMKEVDLDELRSTYNECLKDTLNENSQRFYKIDYVIEKFHEYEWQKGGKQGKIKSNESERG